MPRYMRTELSQQAAALFGQLKSNNSFCCETEHKFKRKSQTNFIFYLGKEEARRIEVIQEDCGKLSKI